MAYYLLSELAERTHTELSGDPAVTIDGVGSLASAKPGQITFFSDRRHARWLAGTSASAIVLAAKHRQSVKKPMLIAANPAVAFAHIAQLFSIEPQPVIGIDPMATVAPGCQLGQDVAVAAGARIGENVTIGARSVIGANCVVGAHASIGSDCRLYANVTLAHHVRLHNRVIIHAGAVVGADGFGIAFDAAQGWVKMPQCGSVVLHDDVEVGANTTIDRGTLGDTVLEADVRVDNLVQIAHNVQVGQHTAIAGCTGIAGSTKIGSRCLIGGATKINGHIEICDNAGISGGSIVLRSITTPGKHSEWNPVHAAAAHDQKAAATHYMAQKASACLRNGTLMDVNQILRLLPHRYPMLLVDKVVEIIPERSIKALKNVTYNESFFRGHFPKQPMMPGVLVIEALAQTCCLLATQHPRYDTMMEQNGLMLFTGIDKARFKHPVLPGDTLLLHGEIRKVKTSATKVYARFQTHALVEDRVTALAELHMMLHRPRYGANT